VQMDPLEGIAIGGDSTFALMLEAQARGHGLFVYQPEGMAMTPRGVTARGRWVMVRDVEGDHFSAGEDCPCKFKNSRNHYRLLKTQCFRAN